MKVNSKGIYGTTQSPFKRLPFDGRCTRKGRTLYFHVFQLPVHGRIAIPAMKATVVSAKALATGQNLTVDGDALVWGAGKPDPFATTIEVTLSGEPQPVEVSFSAKPSANGTLELKAADAETKGGVQLEKIDGVQSIGFWVNAADALSWQVAVPKAGSYTVEADVACPDEDAGSVVTLGGASLTVPATGDWHTFKVVLFEGTVKLKAGKQALNLAVKSMKSGAVMNVRRVVLKPATG